MTQVSIQQHQWNQMRSHVEAGLPFEACGLLGGSENIVSEVIPMANTLRSPTRFRMDPAEQIRAFDHLEAGGLELVGIFHSHPSLPEASSEPSATDIAEAAYPVVHVVWSRRGLGWQARGFMIEEGRATEVELCITQGS